MELGKVRGQGKREGTTGRGQGGWAWSRGWVTSQRTPGKVNLALLKVLNSLAQHLTARQHITEGSRLSHQDAWSR